MATHSASKQKNSQFINESVVKRLKRRHFSVNGLNDAKIDKLFNAYINLIKTKLEDKDYHNCKQLVIDCHQVFQEMKTNNDHFLKKKSFLELINKVSRDIGSDVRLDNILLFHNTFMTILNKKKSKSCDESLDKTFDDKTDLKTDFNDKQSIDNNFENTCYSVSEDRSDFLDNGEEEEELLKDVNEELVVGKDTEELELKDEDVSSQSLVMVNNSVIVNEINDNNNNRCDDYCNKIVDDIQDEYEAKETTNESQYLYKGTIYPEVNKRISHLINDFIEDEEKKWFGPNGLKLQTIPIFKILTLVKQVIQENNLEIKPKNINSLVDRIFVEVKKIVINLKKNQLIVID